MMKNVFNPPDFCLFILKSSAKLDYLLVEKRALYIS